jgi:hypothetical protein
VKARGKITEDKEIERGKTMTNPPSPLPPIKTYYTDDDQALSTRKEDMMTGSTEFCLKESVEARERWIIQQLKDIAFHCVRKNYQKADMHEAIWKVIERLERK